MTKNVNVKFWKEFFALYRSLPATWMVKHELYRNKSAKENAYQTLLVKYREMDRMANIDTLKKKINNLRGCYRRELKKLRLSEKTAVRDDDVYEPMLWYFTELDFLRDQETQTVGKSSIDLEMSQNFDDMDAVETEANCESSKNCLQKRSMPLPMYISAAFKRKKVENNPVLQKQLFRLQETFQQKQIKRYDWLGKQVIFRINQIHDVTIQLETANSIQCILRESLSKENQALDPLDGLETILNATSSSLNQNNTEGELHELEQQVMELKELIKNKFGTTYDWLGKQVTDEVSKIKDEEIREETVWAVQSLLRENVNRDKLLAHDDEHDPETSNPKVEKMADSTLNVDCSDDAIERFLVDITARNGNIESS